MSFKKSLKAYFTFSRNDRIGLVILMCALLGIFTLPRWLKPAPKPPVVNQSVLARLDTIAQKNDRVYESADEASYDPAAYEKKQFSLFYFDPNTLSTEGWGKLGIRTKTALTIQKYISKGGNFKQASDLQKVYGLSASDYARISPYVRLPISEGFKENTKVYEPKDENKSIAHFGEKPAVKKVEINAADAESLIALPGIGAGRAKNILNFRDKLGGFFSTDQVAETYGLPDSVFVVLKKYLLCNTSLVKKINLNAATVDEMKAHPYISWSIAKIIVQYRETHGKFKKVEDLRNIVALDEKVYVRLAPYFSIGDQ